MAHVVVFGVGFSFGRWGRWVGLVINFDANCNVMMGLFPRALIVVPFFYGFLILRTGNGLLLSGTSSPQEGGGSRLREQSATLRRRWVGLVFDQRSVVAILWFLTIFRPVIAIKMMLVK